MSGYIDEQVKDLIINQLTREEYQELKEQGLIKRNEIYLFPDATEEDIEIIKEKLRELIDAHNELDEAVQLINDVIWGSPGEDGLIDRVNDIDERVTTIEHWIYGQGSEDGIEARVSAVETVVRELPTVEEFNTQVNEIHQHINRLEGEVEEFNEMLIYCGTSTDVMGESSEV